MLRNIWSQPFNSDPLFDQINQHFEQFVALNCSIHPEPVMARSWLANIPVRRPQTSYPIIQQVRHGSDSAQREHLTLSKDDAFDFKLFALPSKHVQIINTIFLDNAASTLAITFGTRTALRRALESYLQLEKPGIKVIYRNGNSGFTGPVKECVVPSNHDHEKYLLGLEKTLASLGSTVKAKRAYSEPNLEVIMPALPSKFTERYAKLGKRFDLM